MTKKAYELNDAAAASASINKTLKEVDAILSGEELEHAGELRTKLRETLIHAFEGVGKKWYRLGFNRGHREAYKEYSKGGSFPSVLATEKRRQIVSAGKKRKIKLKSTIDKK